MRGGPWVVLASAVSLLTGCSSLATSLQHRAVDTAMAIAYRPADRGKRLVLASGHTYEVLAGDLHCHVSPPDGTSHVIRGLGETARLATSEGLDFVVLTPHVRARFFASERGRAYVLAQQAALREAIRGLPRSDVLFIPGLEYTDSQFGHVGVSFSDIDRLLDALPLHEARAHPERFFERHVAAGGLLVVNHPFTTPTNFVVRISRADLSWRPFTQPGLSTPPEIDAVSRLAQGYEAFNLTTTDLRDRFLLHDHDRSLRQTLEKLDTEIVRQHRRMAPVGGSDSHSHHLRPTTFVLAESRTPAAVRDAIAAGRTCVRDPGACTFRVRAPGGDWVPVGGALEGVREIEVVADGGAVEVRRAGEVVARPEPGVVSRMSLPDSSCAVLRARVGVGESAAIYVNCGLPPG